MDVMDVPLIVVEELVAPAEAVADDTVEDGHAEDGLLFERHDQGEVVADAHVLSGDVVGRVPGVDVHHRFWQRCRQRLGSGSLITRRDAAIQFQFQFQFNSIHFNRFQRYLF